MLKYTRNFMVKVEREITTASEQPVDSENNLHLKHTQRLTHLIISSQIIFDRKKDTLTETQKKMSLSIAAMITDPLHLKTLANNWKVREEDLRVYIRDGMYDKAIKQIGIEIYDEVQKQSKDRDSFERKFAKAITELPQALNDRQIQILNLIQQDIPRSEIAQRMNLTERNLKQIIVSIRRVAEQQFIFPANIKRGASYRQSNINTALSHKRLNGIKFLNIFYTDDSQVKNYRSKQKKVNNELVRKNFVPLSTAVSEREYKTFKKGKKYQKYLKKDAGRTYVHIDTIPKLQELRNKHPLTIKKT